MGKIKKLKVSREIRTKDQSLVHQIVHEDVVTKPSRVKERSKREEKQQDKVSFGR